MVALFTKSLSEWNKMNSTALGLIQGKLNPALWPDYVDVGDAATFWTRLETKYGKAGGACQNLSLVCSVVGRHLGCPRCTVIGTQCV